jgi:hypothetical protein
MDCTQCQPVSQSVSQPVSVSAYSLVVIILSVHVKALLDPEDTHGTRSAHQKQRAEVSENALMAAC